MTSALLTPDAMLSELFMLVYEVAFLGGLAGGLVWWLFMSILDLLGRWANGRDVRDLRIAAARMRNVHGPALYPGFSRRARHALIRSLRARHAASHG